MINKANWVVEPQPTRNKNKDMTETQTGGARLYYLDDIPTPYRLGVQRRIGEQWLGSFKITYCAASEPGRDWSFDFGDLDVEILPGRQYRPPNQVNPMSVKWNPSVRASLAAFRPDVVVLSGYLHPTMYLAALWCRQNGVPYAVACETSARSTTTTGAKGRIKRGVAGWLVRGMAFGLPVGQEAGEYLRSLGSPDAPLHYFPNTPDTSIIVEAAEQIRKDGREDDLRRRLGIPPGDRIVLFVGRMIDAKRPLDALEAFRLAGAATSDATLVFVGDGPLLEQIKAAATGVDNVVFTGWLTDPAQTAALMAISAVMVLPSQHETWGAVVNEAMAAGTPVIASDRVGSAIELIESEVSGIIYPVGDTGALADAIARVLLNDALRRDMGRAGKKMALAKGEIYAAGNLIEGASGAVARARASS
ncbi:glycosyltransferase family 4 protein [Sulfuriferula sp.]|uniref:glycosyltransferase family 4 protein n=1 Tax=Sulfuriferula sp. TaxID=2025307 RepID=UPI002731AB82|nr:glycosyltransferase family 4 protein [Sulfuriferula sp.]MDP2024891.1 glycosyltransferase family 4 protein [Sulfuriferula sp.]